MHTGCAAACPPIGQVRGMWLEARDVLYWQGGKNQEVERTGRAFTVRDFQDLRKEEGKVQSRIKAPG